MLTEAVFGPLWALLFINETPPISILLGGGIIIISILLQLFYNKKKILIVFYYTHFLNILKKTFINLK